MEQQINKINIVIYCWTHNNNSVAVRRLVYLGSRVNIHSYVHNAKFNLTINQTVTRKTGEYGQSVFTKQNYKLQKSCSQTGHRYML